MELSKAQLIKEKVEELELLGSILDNIDLEAGEFIYVFNKKSDILSAEIKFNQGINKALRNTLIGKYNMIISEIDEL